MPLSIPFVLKRSPLVAILPDMLARMFAAHTDLCFEPLPVDGLSLPISLVSHRRERSDPLIEFVARLLVESVEEWVVASGA
jgi:DNA-binding transcriptional LysR family regulator